MRILWQVIRLTIELEIARPVAQTILYYRGGEHESAVDLVLAAD